MITVRHRFATVLVGGLVVLTLAACGSNSAAGSGGQNGQAGGSGGQASGSGGQRAGRGNGIPGVSGLIVALSGKTMQVRTSTGQSAVTYTTKTSITQEKSAKAADAGVGMCAVVRGTDTASASPSAGSAKITARTVNLSDAVDGSCRAGFGGARPSGAAAGGAGAHQGQPPAGTGSTGPGGARGRFGGAVGKITAVSGSSITIEATRGGTSATPVTVTLTADTTFTALTKTDTRAIAKDGCVFATGKTDSTGAMTAQALRLSAAVDGSCEFGGGRGAGVPSGGRSGG